MATKTPKTKFKTIIKPDGDVILRQAVSQDAQAVEARRVGGWVSTIQEANFRMEAGHQSAVANYNGTPIARGVAEPHALAKALSQKFETMRFVVVYDRGEHSIVGEPVSKQWATEGEDYALERSARDAERFIGEVVRTHWPNFNVVKAWADGFTTAPSNRDRVKELERETERLRGMVSYMPPMMMMPYRMWGPFAHGG